MMQDKVLRAIFSLSGGTQSYVEIAKIASVSGMDMESLKRTLSELKVSSYVRPGGNSDWMLSEQGLRRASKL